MMAVHKTEDTVYECQECDYSTDKLHRLRKVRPVKINVNRL